MRAYKIENWCNLGPRIIVHPHGLPPSWKEGNLPPEVEEQARRRARCLDRVVHLDAETLEVIQTLPIV